MKRLVILAPNWLGDAVMALPAIADVRRVAPDASIAIAARPIIAPLFGLVPAIDDTIVLPHVATLRDPRGWRALGAGLAGGQFDTALLLPNSMHAAIVASRARIPERWGYRAGWRGGLLTRAVRRTSGLHQVEYYQQLVHALGFPNGPLEPSVTVPPAAREAAGRVLEQAGWDGRTPLVAFAPGAAYGGAKRWPAASFAELAAALAADGVRSVMVGSAADAATGREVLSALGRRGSTDPVTDLIGTTDLATLAGVLSHCRALVTNDSGAMHLGAAVGISVTAVFGPTDERATRPLGDAHRVVLNPVWCRPCMLRECPIDHRCMRGIGVAAVLDAARRTL
jgi:lipopolysaccharide heptosyltransferase II